MACGKNEFSIWMIPDGQAFYDLDRLIKNLNERFATPRFQPHVTLIGKLKGQKDELVEKCREVIADVEPFSLYLESISYRNNIYRSLFANVVKTTQLVNLRKRAERVFAVEGEEYHPHLSLMYNFFVSHLKEKIIRDLGYSLNLSFSVDKIHLFFTSGDPTNWYKIGDFILQRIL